MKIGIIGAGYVGRALAGVAVKNGHEVMISNSRGPQTLFSDSFMLGCKVGTIEEAAQFGELVIVAITMKHYKSVPVEAVAGKIVIDTNNYYRPATRRLRSWTASGPPAASCWRRICRHRRSSRRLTRS